MIKKIYLKFGSSGDEDKLEFEPTPITIFVGPNNSGKSIILKEIYQICQNGQFTSNNLILRDILPKYFRY